MDSYRFLLNREEISFSEEALREQIKGQTVLVTGAGGSIGSEIVRKVSRVQPAEVILLGHGENSIHAIYLRMQAEHPEVTYIPVICDIRDEESILTCLTRYQPVIVYHAAAHKHVPLMEMNPREAISNNIQGTYKVACAVAASGCRKMVFVSTDKAVHAQSVMGATKRFSELLMFAMNAHEKTKYCVVRLGNVLGSRGSVIPIFEEQLAAGTSLTLTDKRMRRYFMTLEEAGSFITYAGSYSQGGETFVPDLGEPIHLLEIIHKLKSRQDAESPLELLEVGMRPGEKLDEALLIDSLSPSTSFHPLIWEDQSTVLSLDHLLKVMRELLSREQTDEELKTLLFTFIKTENCS